MPNPLGRTESRVPSVYKYMTPARADRMTGLGSIRVGTLHEYRTLEGVDVRGDQGEGRRTITSAPGPTTYEEGSHIHKWLLSKGIRIGGSVFTGGENAVVSEHNFVNCFIYCVSSQCTLHLVEKFGGACVEIVDPAAFFQTLDGALRQHLQPLGCRIRDYVVDRCVYEARSKPYFQSWEKHQCFTKPPQFSDEAEVRALWVPTENEITPVVLELPAITRLLRRTHAP